MSEHDEDDSEEAQRARRRSHLIALVVVVVLVLGGLWLSNVLRSASNIQDCVMSGRTNCVRIN
jgi:cell division septal protein FtsQ